MSVTIVLIAALAQDHGIGKKGSLPWHLPDDLKRFRQLTIGKPILMGRRTWESLPRRPLPDRRNIVLSRTVDMLDGATVVRSLEDAIAAAQTEGAAAEMVVIGGAEVYAQALPFADRLELTWVIEEIEGCDAFFPIIDPSAWLCQSSVLSSAGDCVYATLDRKPSS